MKKLLSLLSIIALCACSSDKEILEGKREAILSPLKVETIDSSIKVKLPKPTVNKLWSQNGGNSQHFMGHLASQDTLKEAFDISFGQGDSKRSFLISTPVVSKGIIYTIDADATIMAHNLSDGEELFEVEIEPKNEDDDAISMKGAGVAVYDNKVYATTGYGSVHALDAKTGKILWSQELSSPIRIAPTVNNNRVFVQTVDNLLVCLNSKTGAEIWRHQAAQNATILVGGASPTYAANEDILIAAFSNGQVQAFKASTGSVLWSDFVINLRQSDAISSINTIKANPVIDGQVLYVIGHNNIFVAIDIKTGQRIWDKNIGSTNQPWVSGGFVYALSNDLTLMAIEASSGTTVWQTKIPNNDGEEGIVASGPVLTQNRLLVATSNGYIFSFSPYSGKNLGHVTVSDGVEVSPVVADRAVIFTTKEADMVVYK